MKRVTIQPGCISCGTCELIAPEVFVLEVTAQVRPECVCSRYAEKIKEAARQCPVGVIVVDDGNKEK